MQIRRQYRKHHNKSLILSQDFHSYQCSVLYYSTYRTILLHIMITIHSWDLENMNLLLKLSQSVRSRPRAAPSSPVHEQSLCSCEHFPVKGFSVLTPASQSKIYPGQATTGQVLSAQLTFPRRHIERILSVHLP